MKNLQIRSVSAAMSTPRIIYNKNQIRQIFHSQTRNASLRGSDTVHNIPVAVGKEQGLLPRTVSSLFYIQTAKFSLFKTASPSIRPTYTAYIQEANVGNTPLDQHPPIPNGLPLTDPDKGALVYIGEHATVVKRVKRFSLFTSCITIGLMPAMYVQLQSAHLAAAFLTYGVSGLFAFGTPLLLHHVCKRYVTHMYYNDVTEEYHANTFTFFLKDNNRVLKIDDIRAAHSANAFETVNVKGQPLFVDHLGFLRKDALLKFFKYDKPFDLLEEMKKLEKEKKEKEDKSN